MKGATEPGGVSVTSAETYTDRERVLTRQDVQHLSVELRHLEGVTLSRHCVKRIHQFGFNFVDALRCIALGEESPAAGEDRVTLRYDGVKIIYGTTDRVVITVGPDEQRYEHERVRVNTPTAPRLGDTRPIPVQLAEESRRWAARNGPVVVRRRPPDKGWSLADAVTLVTAESPRGGYSVEQAARITGWPAAKD